MLDYSQVPSPCFVLDETRLRRNMEILDDIQKKTGVKIICALKGYSFWRSFPLIGEYLAGATASSLNEARLAREEMNKEVHVFAPVYEDDEIDAILDAADHITFNSFSQWQRYKDKTLAHGVSAGIRVNPEFSTVETDIYNPCGKFSRLGVTEKEFKPELLDGIDGLHFHALCEQDADALEGVLAAFERHFGKYLPQMKWVNFGGGHHITRKGYDVDGLVALLNDFKARHPHLVVYLEPGEAIALNAGTLESRVLEIQPKGADGISNAILDTSAACHMPDVIEMPYTPPLIGATICRSHPSSDRLRGSLRSGDTFPIPRSSAVASAQADSPFIYRFGGPTCLAGDEIGVYSFKHELHEGDTVVFGDMAIYTMVKNNTFNGVSLPDIVVRHVDGSEEIVRKFGYDDFACRL